MDKTRIRDLRRSRRMTQGELGSILDVAQTTVSAWERGYHVPDIREREKMCQLFNVSDDYLMGEGPDEPLEPVPPASNYATYEDAATSQMEKMLAAQLPGGMGYNDISMEGMLEMMKFYEYLRHAYPRHPHK